jgi:hypothetical protein
MYDPSAILDVPIWLLIIVLIWSLTWKALALWKSARKKSTIWFTILFVTIFINTIGILDILYYYIFSEMKFDDPPAKKPTKGKKKN